MIEFNEFTETAGELLDIIGVIILLGGFILSSSAALVRTVKAKSVHHLYRSYRQNIARSILVGLEFLIAGDILRSVANDITLSSVSVLGVLIIIRLVLGASLEMEIAGHWPWQHSKNKQKLS